MKQTFCSLGLDISKSCCSNTGWVRISSTIRTYPLDIASSNASPTRFISSTRIRSSTICGKYCLFFFGLYKYIFSNNVLRFSLVFINMHFWRNKYNFYYKKIVPFLTSLKLDLLWELVIDFNKFSSLLR